MEIYGQNLTYQELLKRVGHLSQIAGIEKQRICEGPADDMLQYKVKTGNYLEFTVLPTKCMDIGELSYKGINISYIAKPGLSTPSGCQTDIHDFLRDFPAGMLYTCGLSNVGVGCTDENNEYHPQHGRIANTRAENVYAKQTQEGDEISFELGGSTREAALFGRNIVLHRKLKTKVGSRSVILEDTVENQTANDYPILMLYHFNFGYPFISEETQLFFEDSEVKLRDGYDEDAIAKSTSISSPNDNEAERVFIRRINRDKPASRVRIENRTLGIGAELSYRNDNLPYLIQWKSMASGDYVLGIEPSTCELNGRVKEIEHGNGCCVNAFDSKDFRLELSFYDI